MSVKGGIIKLYNFLSVKWGSYESAGEINTVAAADPKTVTVKVGTDMSSLTEKEIENGEDLSEDSDFQSKKFIQVIPTLRGGDSTDPLLKNIVINAVETLESFISNPSSHIINLIEMTIAEELTGWAIESGATYKITYYTDTITLRDDKTRTIFKPLSSVEENGESLSLQTSIVTVEANAGSYWHDTANSILYVHFSNGGDGEDKTIIGRFPFYAASENIIFDNNFYEGRISNLTPVSNKTSYIFWGTSDLENGSFTLNNCDGFFDKIYEKYIWEKGTITIKIGSDFMAYDDFLTIFVGKIENKKWKENNFWLDFFSKKKELDKMIPSDEYDTTTYPNIENNAVGRFIPIAYGTFDSLEDAPFLVCINKKYGENSANYTSDPDSNETTLKDTELASSVDDYYKGWEVEYGGNISKITKYVGSTKTATMETLAGFTTGLSYTIRKYNQQQYKIAGHTITSIETVYINYMDGIGWQKISSTDTLATATFIITTNDDGRYGMYEENVTKVKALFTGKNSDGNASDIAKDLCQTYGGLANGDLNLTSFSDSQTEADLPIQIYINTQVSIRDIIDKIILSCFGYFYTGIDGKLNFVVWTTSRSTGYDEFQDYEYLNFNTQSIGSDLRNKISVGYSKNYEKDEFHYTTTTNNDSIYKYSEREIEYVNTYLKAKSDAETMAQRMMWVVNQPGRYVNFGTHLRPVQKNIGDKIYVTKEKSPNLVAGGMPQVLMEVIGIERDVENGMVNIECIDTRGMGLNVGIWMAAAAPNWGAATDEEKTVSGFWTDANGYASAPDGYMHSRWW